MKNNKKGAAKREGGAVNAEDPAAAAKQIERLGAAKDWGGNKGDESAKTKAKVKEVKADAKKDYDGSPRMGYTQNFGPSRQGGYAKGAAKVNSIMGKGPAQAVDVLASKDVIGKKIGSGEKQSKYQDERMLASTAYIDSLKQVQSGKGQEAKTMYGKKFSGGTFDYNLLPDTTKTHVETKLASGGYSQSDIVDMLNVAKGKSKGNPEFVMPGDDS